ncbi:hypothetical protein ACFY12_21520 [Streptomyces sp. NPDC001339]|uniref:hypothetical protein n=1 Tax=Streptomyces sp. NPDC001339 TaxID=3364563 RepID=UPI0036952919
MESVRRVQGRAVPVVVGAVVLAVCLTACGDGKSRDGGVGKQGGARASERKDAGVVLAAAAKKTAEQNAYRTRQSGGSSEEATTDMAWQRKPFFSSMKVHGKKTEDNPSGETYLVDTADGTYTKTDKIPGKDWFRLEPSGDKKPDRSRSRGLLTEFLGALNATGSAKWLGAEQVGGRPTDHFQGAVTIADLAKYQGSAMEKDSREWYVDVMRRGGKERAVIDVWVGKDNLVAKAQEVSSGKNKKGEAKEEKIVEEYSGYGADLKAEIPSPDKVASFDEYIQALAKRRPSA